MKNGDVVSYKLNGRKLTFIGLDSDGHHIFQSGEKSNKKYQPYALHEIDVVLIKEFKIEHLFFDEGVDVVNENTAPPWLKYGGPKGSTTDNRWFWNDMVMNLRLGEIVCTDFRKITRVK